MTNTSAFINAPNGTVVQGQKIEAAEFIALDDNGVRAIPRNGTTPITANVKIQLNGHSFQFDCTDNSAGAFSILLGNADLTIDDSFAGTGKMHVPASKLVLDGTGYPTLGSRTEVRAQRGVAHEQVTFAFDTATKVYLSSVALGHANFELNNLIDGATMTAVSLIARGDYGTDFVSLPASMPFLQVYKLTSAGVLTSLGTATDASGTVGAFNGDHTITVSGLTEVISSANRYFAYVFAPGGANYVANTYGISAITATHTCTSLRPGG